MNKDDTPFDLMVAPKPKLGDGRYKDGNPKTLLGIKKPGNFYSPTIPHLEYSMAHMQGAFKYGIFNWRFDPISISTYLEAAERHIALYKEGQRVASDTGIHHLAHAMCCLSILIDAEAHNTLIDDRWYTLGSLIAYDTKDPSQVLEAYIEAQAPKIKKIYDDWYGHAEAVKEGRLEEWKASKKNGDAK